MNTGSAVWWGPLVTAGATLLGIIIGFLLNWARDARAERQRWKREDQLRAEAQRREDAVRYNRERIEAYAALLQQGHLLMDQVLNREETARWRDTTAQFQFAYFRAVLLASGPVREVADDYYSTTLHFMPHIGGSTATHAMYVERHKALVDAVRREFSLG